MTDLFCKKIVNEVMPAVRAVISENLDKEGMKQREIAGLLSVTQPAVVNYAKGSRGKMVHRIKSNREFMKIVDELTNRILNKEDLVKYTCYICKKARETQLIKRSEMEPFICAKEL